MLKRRGTEEDSDPWATVEEINRAWKTGDAAGIGHLFHPDAVIVHPGFEGRTEGREACVQSYVDFAGQARISRLEEFDRQIDVVDDTAVVTYGFEIDYEMDGQVYEDGGTDVFVLTRSDGGWQAIWRTLVMDSE